MHKITMILAAVAAPFFAEAATLQVDGTGELTGARGVDVDGAFYNVSFTDGTCIDLFDGCDAPEDFAFSTEASAQQAALALLAQVFLDGPLGSFDTDPELTRGCGEETACVAVIPYERRRTDLGGVTSIVETVWTRNSAGSNTTTSTGEPASLDLSGEPFRTYAIFSEITPVPLPAGVWALLSGLGALVLLRHRRPT